MGTSGAIARGTGQAIGVEVSAGILDARRAAVPWTGIGRYVRALVKGFSGEDGRETVRFVAGGSLNVVSGPGTAVEDLSQRHRKLVWEQLALPVWSSHFRPGFLHLPYYEGPPYTYSPLIVTIHDLDTLTNPGRYSPQYRLYYNGLLRLLAHRAARVIAPSRTTARDLHAHMRLEESKVVVIPQGIDDEFRAPDAERGRILRSRLGVEQETRVVVAGAGVASRKNLSTLFSALGERVLRDHRVHLLVTGTTSVPTREAVRPPHRVSATGILATNDLAALYSVADASVCPSLNEGFGFAVVEAMAAGCPVIASRAGSHPEIVGDAALLFDPRNSEGLASCLAQVLQDRSLRDSLRCRGAERAAGFTWDRTISMTRSVYSEILQA